MLPTTGEILPVIRDAWTPHEPSRKEVPVVAPVGKVNGGTTGKLSDEKLENRENPSTDGQAGSQSQVAEEVQSYLSEALNVELKFQVDSTSGQTVIQVLDKETGDVIRQIPPENLLEVRDKLEELRGILFDVKA